MDTSVVAAAKNPRVIVPGKWQIKFLFSGAMFAVSLVSEVLYFKLCLLGLIFTTQSSIVIGFILAMLVLMPSSQFARVARL